VRHQFKQYQESKKQSSVNTATVIIDFSENYNCKYTDEVQSVHFGASNQQATLHTGVVDFESSPLISFCSISSSLRHDAVAIWAHLKPLFAKMQKDYPYIQKIHIWSDGPTTQYRNKDNFWLFSNMINEMGFTTATWNLFEASHGKGAADAIGGVLKRTADNMVNQGTDIPDAVTLFKVLKKETKVELFYVSQEDITTFEETYPKMQLQPVKGTMKLHQLLLIEPGKIKVRDFSCFCSATCECFNPRLITFPVLDKQTSVDQTQREARIHTDQGNAIKNSGLKDNSMEIGEWCVVQYEGKLFPGEILEMDQDGTVLVTVLHPIGDNKFVTPPREDKLWYSNDDVIAKIPKPTKSTARSRFFHIPADTWKAIKKD